MSENKELLEKLRVVIDPEIGISIVDLEMVKGLIVENGIAYVKIALTVSGCPMAGSIENDVKKVLLQQPGISNVVVEMGSMTQEELKAVGAKIQKIRSENPSAGSQNQKVGSGKLSRKGIQKVIAVMSGKGGVGKSYVTSAIAVELRRQGFEVGILDGDLTGPSIGKMFGISSKPVIDQNGARPVESATGIKIISMNMFLDVPESPVIWRGPVIDQVIRQLFDEVVWGDLHFLLVDLPPGTGDAPLTVMQSLPVDATVIVSTPQDLAMLIVKKSINMVHQLKVPLAGIVENMSYMVCPHCSNRIEMFEESDIEKEAGKMGVNFLGRLPFDPKVNRLADAGKIEEYSNEVIRGIADKVRNSASLQSEINVAPLAWKKTSDSGKIHTV
ncbi:MAG: Mrp/NBP35 family ATP-binding protein [Nitrososphaerales archaeon]|jgi:Mrp family chromosome partitioning ATPase